MNPLIVLLVYEAGVQVKEWRERATVYSHAKDTATEAGVPLVVVGCPKFALHHGTGDVCIDLEHPFWCRCTNPVTEDVNNLGEMFAEKSIVLFTSHVLEHLEADEAVRVVNVIDRVAIAHNANNIIFVITNFCRFSMIVINFTASRVTLAIVECTSF